MHSGAPAGVSEFSGVLCRIETNAAIANANERAVMEGGKGDVRTIGYVGKWLNTGSHRDGAAGEAKFNYPVGVAVEASGSVLVADNHCVRRVSADGQRVTTVAGAPGKSGHRDGAAGEAQFKYPQGVAVEASGSVLVADNNNHCVRVVTGLGLAPLVAAAPLAEGSAQPEPEPEPKPEPEPQRIPEAVTPVPSPLQQLCAMGHARDEARAADADPS